MPKKKHIDRVREICLGLPETSERLSHGEPAWFVASGARVGGTATKMFATCEDHHHGDPIVGLWVKGAPGAQEILVANEPERYYRPKYVGHQGWIGVLMEGDIDWATTEDLIRESYRMTAPKRLASLPD